MKNLEIKTITHKKINIVIKIDYDHGEVSLVEMATNGKYKKKEWIFAERGLEFMPAWKNILEAMQLAVKEGEMLLEQNLAEKTKFERELIISMSK
jgi:hypothetical protein